MWYHVVMNAPKVMDLDDINFLVEAPKVVSCTEAAHVQPDSPDRAIHDGLTRLLRRMEPSPTQQFLAGPKALLRGFEQATGAHKPAPA